VYVRELTVKYRLRRVPKCHWPLAQLGCAAAMARVVVPLLAREIVEVCGVLCLNTRFELLAYHELSRGTVDATFVQPRDVFRTALLAHAQSVVVAHNHPSGDPTPSADDVGLTRRLAAAGDLLGVSLLDHLIVALDGRYYSFQESGHL
jgi:DNA repair protein RadC